MIIAFILLFLFLSALYSGSETGIVSFNHFKLRYQLVKGNRSARYISNFLNDSERFLVTILTGNNIANVCITACVTLLLSKYGVKDVSLYTTLLVTPVILIFGEVVPKAIFSSRSDVLVPYVIGFLHLSSKFFYPLIFIIKKLPVLKYIHAEKETFFVKREEIKLLVERITEEGILEEQEQDAIHEVFTFTTTKIKDVYVPMHKVVKGLYSYTEQQIKDLSFKSGYTRFPIFKGKQIIGVVNVFDLLFIGGQWQNHIRRIRKVSVTQHIDKVFEHMQDNKETMAAVVDGKGAVCGIVTTMDLMRKIASLIAE